MKKILVAGGTSYIGSHTSVALVAAGYEVCILDNLCNSHIEVLARIEKISRVKPQFIQADIRDTQALHQVFAKNKFAAVIHFAGLKSIGESNIHPLVIEDILNTNQRVKVEEYDDYLFLVLKKLNWDSKRQVFNTEQISIVFGPGFLISFQEQKNSVFDDVQHRIVRGKARLREYGSDYLAYSLLDTVVDQYFLVLESFGEQIENIEELIVAHPTPENAHSLYHLKRQVFMFRKAIWPLRDVINNLLKADERLITHFTTFYLGDVYDHTIQVIDSVEIFRDMLSSMLDAYLSSLTNRMNEIMKVLAIIATLFIPLTFITGVYGMNFEFMPEVHWRWGYPITMGIMILVAIGMLIYFRGKRWF